MLVNSAFWRINREWLVGLAGGRALLMELAHPLIAAGVAEHSNFRKDPLGRLLRTMRVMTQVTFGDQEARRRALRHFHTCHQHVNGALSHHEGILPAGTFYHAHDSALKFWVLATLIDSIFMAHDYFIAPLTFAERQTYYQESLGLTHLLGIPATIAPADYASFKVYVDTMLTGNVLSISATARELVQALLFPRQGRVVARVVSFFGIGLLPERLRLAYGFCWSDQQEKKLQHLARFSRRLRKWLPNAIFMNPYALLAEWKMRNSKNQP